jgi:hypothetical protein
MKARMPVTSNIIMLMQATMPLISQEMKKCVGTRAKLMNART